MNDKSDGGKRYNSDAHTNVMLFPQSWIDLSQELSHPFHQSLRDQLDIDALFAAASFSTNIACICTYVDILVDGEYTQDDFDKLFEVIVKRLRRKRGMIDAMASDIILIN